MEMNHFSYEEIKQGQVYEFKKNITNEDITTFSNLTGDKNPLHCDENYASKTRFKGVIVPGMLASSMFSTLFGMLCPGKKNLYLTQTLNFESPIKPNSEITVRGIVTRKIDSLKIICFDTHILVNGNIAIKGEAKIKVMEE